MDALNLKKVHSSKQFCKNKKKYALMLGIFAFIFISAFFIYNTNEVLALDKNLKLTNPMEKTGISTPQQFIGLIINIILGMVGSIALVMFIYGGFTWMTSQGNQEKVTKGKNIIVWAVLGLIVVFTSYMAVNFIITALTTK